MLPHHKFNDAESSSILRAIKEDEKIIANTPSLQFDKRNVISRTKALPPLKPPIKHPTATPPKVYAHQPLHRTTSTGVTRKYSDNTISYDSRGDYGYSEMTRGDFGYSNTDMNRNMIRNNSFDSPRNYSEEQALRSRHPSLSNSYSNGNSDFEQNRNIDDFPSKTQRASDSDVRDRRYYDFDAYLKHAVEKREGDKLFDTAPRSDNTNERKRMERPKSAYYGRRRPQSGIGNAGNYPEHLDLSFDVS